MNIFDSFAGAHGVSIRRGREVQKYLEEKLSPRQILYNRDSFEQNEAFHMHTSDTSAIWFRIYDVPVQFWEKVIRPELERMAKRFDCEVKFIYDRYKTQDGYIEFFIAKKDVEESPRRDMD